MSRLMLVAVVGIGAALGACQGNDRRSDDDRNMSRVGGDAPRLAQDWPVKQREQIAMMTRKYGEPDGVTPHAVTWKDAGPFAMVMIERDVVDHRFPMAHVDFMTHTVRHEIIPDRADELAAFDGSVYIDRTGGLLSAKCDTEPHNMLALNLAHDVMMGNKSVDQARQEYARIVQGEMQGRMHPYLERLQFQPQGATAAVDPDVPEM